MTLNSLLQYFKGKEELPLPDPPRNFCHETFHNSNSTKILGHENFPLYGIFNFGQIFAFSEIHPKVSRGSNQYLAKLTVKDLAL